MEVRINGKFEEIREGTTLLDFIKERNLNPDSLVIEYNSVIIKPKDFTDVTFRHGDRVEILRFVGGG